MPSSSNYDKKFANWIKGERSAVSLLNSVGKLMYDKGIEVTKSGNSNLRFKFPARI